MADRAPFWTGDYLHDRRFTHHRGPDSYVRQSGVKSILAAPLFDGEDTIGALLVESYRKDAYDEAAADRLSSLALQASIAISNARLFAALAQSREEIARRAEAERTLREIAAEVTALRDPREVVQLVIRAATTLLHGDVAELGLAGDADPIYAFVGASSLPGVDGASPPTVIAGIGLWASPTSRGRSSGQATTRATTGSSTVPVSMPSSSFTASGRPSRRRSWPRAGRSGR